MAKKFSRDSITTTASPVSENTNLFLSDEHQNITAESFKIISRSFKIYFNHTALLRKYRYYRLIDRYRCLI